MTTPAPRAFATAIRDGEWPLAVVMAASLAQHHPGSHLHVLALDGAGEQACVPGMTVHEPEAVGLAEQFVTLLRLTASPTDMRMTVAPALVAHLLSTAAPDGVTYLAPDTMVRGPLPDGDVPGVGMLPRFTRIPEDDGRTPTPDDLLAMSVFDDGFLIAGPGAREGLAAVASGLDTTALAVAGMPARTWDLIAASAPTTAIDDPALGVAYWNADQRTGGITTIRLPGLDATEPYLLSAAQGPHPRVLLSERPDLARIVDERIAQLAEHGMAGDAPAPRLGNLVIDDAVRAACRMALHDDPGAADALVELARDGTGESLAAWLAGTAPGSRDPRVSRYLLGVWADDDHANAAFPYPTDLNAERFIDWVREGHRALGVPARFLPAADTPRTRDKMAMTGGAAPMEQGVNLIGFLRAGFGQGEAARLMHEAMVAGDIPHAAISLTHEGLDDQVESSAADDALVYDINLSCVNVDALEVLSRRMGIDLMEERYSIGTIWWESNLLPSYLVGQMNSYLDEVWVGSTYIADALAVYTDKPIRVFPLPVRIPEPMDPPDRATAGLPEGYLFMFSFDFNSTVARKNPDGVIEAFRRAFPQPSDPQLVIKTINGHRHLPELERLRAITADRNDITIYDGFLPTEQRDAWARAADCYVSLHRSEGFGLTMAEAMAMGKPVIATAYSANLDFMNEDVAFLVPVTEWRLEAQAGPYPVGSLWADPDLDAAAAFMRRAAEYPDAAAAMGARARQHLAETRTQERLAAFIAGRLAEIRTEDLTMRPRPNSRLTLKLNDALAYDRQRHDAQHGAVNRVIRKAMRPYTAGADELDRRILSAMVEMGGRLDEIAQGVKAVRQDLDTLGEVVREDAEHRGD